MSDLEIHSLHNPLVKRVVKLRKRGVRDAERCLLIEGYRELLRAAEAGHAVAKVLWCPELFLGCNEPALIERLEAAGARTRRCGEEAFRKMSYRDRPDGLLGLGDYLDTGLARWSAPPASGLWLVCEAVEKPGNLGTLLRSADAAGVDGVIVCDPATDLHNPNVVRASVGTLFCVPVAEAGTAEALAWLRAHGIAVAAATPDAASPYHEADLRGPVALAVGAEQYGLSERWLDEADLRLRIPMRGKADSLNVAAAATIVLFEALRQRVSG